MSPTRENLHQMLDVIDNSEIPFVFHMFLKLIPEDEPLPDEFEIMKNLDTSPENYINADEIDWDNIDKY
jgi:hypothetical protein